MDVVLDKFLNPNPNPYSETDTDTDLFNQFSIRNNNTAADVK